MFHEGGIRIILWKRSMPKQQICTGQRQYPAKQGSILGALPIPPIPECLYTFGRFSLHVMISCARMKREPYVEDIRNGRETAKRLGSHGADSWYFYNNFN